VRKKIREGLESVKRGELFNGEEVLREIVRESKELREKTPR